MIGRLPPAMQRAFALLLPLGLLALAYCGLVEPLRESAAATRTAMTDMTTRIERYQRVAESLPAQRAALARLTRPSEASGGLLQGTDEALLAAQLQKRVKLLTEAVHGDLRSTQILAARDDGAFRCITVRAELSLDLAATQSVLYGLESGTPYLFVDNLAIHPVAAARQDGSDGVALLDLRFDVSGYVRRTDGPPRRDAPSHAAAAGLKTATFKQ